MSSRLTTASPEREEPLRSSHRSTSAEPAAVTPLTHAMLALQRQVGNAQIQRMLVPPEARAEPHQLQAKRDRTSTDPEAGPEGGPVSEGIEARIQQQRDATRRRYALEHGNRLR